MKKPKVSIIILAFDNPNALEKTLKTLCSNTTYPNFEIIVACNPCDDVAVNVEINDLLVRMKKSCDFKVILNETNLLHGRGCMEGFKISDGEFICFCNDDIFIPASQSAWLTFMMAFMVENENTATLTPSMYSAKERIYWIGKTDPTKPYHDFLHTPKGDPNLPIEPRETCYNNMALCLTKRYLVEEFPLGQSCPHYGSDSEFGNRIKEKYPNMKHMVIPEVRIYHFNIFATRTNYGKNKEIEG